MSALHAPAGIRASMSERWARPGLAAAIGTWAGGPLSIDLERDGPHLLIAGTTGSGKSELLQTVIAGLAISAPPDRTTFLLIDYKGGAAFGPLAELPHTTGVITDLDFSLAARALISLRAELRRREHLLAEHQVADLARLRDRRAAPPSLVIVVDEFATLAAERPEFLAGLLDIAQRGRSLGLHLILATQRPAGVISPAMKANIGLRICLRVTDDADSVDVVDSSRAARLPSGVPGRAVLRFSRSRSILFQVARVSAASGRWSSSATPKCGRHAVRLQGRRPRSARPTWTRWWPRRDWRPPGSNPRARLGYHHCPGVYATADPVLIGLLDRPAEQRQVSWPAPSGSVMVLGSPASGRSSALRRFGWTAAAAGADLLVIDPGQGLRDVAAWPAVRTHLDGQDPLLVQRLVAGSPASSGSGPPLPGPPVLLLVDGWELLSGPLDALDYGTTMSRIADLAARGPAAGITVVVSGDLQLQHHRIASSFTTTVRLGIDERGTAVRERTDRGSGQAGRRRDPDRALRSRRAATAGDEAGHVAAPRGSWCARCRRRSNGATCRLPRRMPFRSGVGGDDASPQFIDLSGPGGGLLISGPRRSGVSTALSVLAVGAAEAGIRVVRGCLQPLDRTARRSSMSTCGRGWRSSGHSSPSTMARSCWSPMTSTAGPRRARSCSSDSSRSPDRANTWPPAAGWTARCEHIAVRSPKWQHRAPGSCCRLIPQTARFWMPRSRVAAGRTAPVAGIWCSRVGWYRYRWPPSDPAIRRDAGITGRQAPWRRTSAQPTRHPVRPW